MKKVALSLLALAVLGTGAFAQEAPALKFGGYLDTGVKVYNKADSGTSSQVVGDDVGAAGGSYDFKFNYGTDKAGVVFAYRLANLVKADAAAPTGIQRNAYAWFLVPGLEAVKVVAGNNGADGLAWNGLDDEGDTQSAGNGYGVVVTPAEGFSFGGFAALSSTAKVDVPTYSVGATYTVPATATVNGVFTTGADKDGKLTAGGFAATAKLLVDGPLSATAGINFYNLQKNGTNFAYTNYSGAGYTAPASGKTGLDLSNAIYDFVVGYKITDAFSASLLTYLYTYGGDYKDISGDSATLSYKINPSISYVVDPITTVGLGATYQSGASVYGVGSGTTADKATFTAVSTPYTWAWGAGYVAQKVTKFQVKPSATFTIDPSSTLLLFYTFDSYSGDNKPAKDQTVSTISAEYRYKF